jgi:hypothetical protein
MVLFLDIDQEKSIFVTFCYKKSGIISIAVANLLLMLDPGAGAGILCAPK